MAVAQTLKMRLQNARKPRKLINDVIVAIPSIFYIQSMTNTYSLK